MVAELDEIPLDRGDRVVVDVEHIFRRELAFFAPHTLLQSPGAVRVAGAAGRDAQRDGVERSDRPVIGTDQPALRGIDHLGQQLVGQEALPIVGAVPALVGGPVVQQRTGRADRQAENRLVPDVALPVAEDAVGAGEGPAAERLLELAHLAGSHHVQNAPGGIPFRLAQGNAFQRHLIAPADPHRNRCDHRAILRPAERQGPGLAAFDLDGLRPDLHVAPLAVEEVLVRVVGVRLEDEEVRLVGAEGGQTPGDIRRKADQDVRAARHAQAAGVEGLAAEVKLIPQRRIADGGLRVADQYGRAGGSLLAADDPGMAEPWSGGDLRCGYVHLLHQVVPRRVVQDLLYPRLADIAPLNHGRIVAHVQTRRARGEAWGARAGGSVVPCPTPRGPLACCLVPRVPGGILDLVVGQHLAQAVAGEEQAQPPPGGEARRRRPRLRLQIVLFEQIEQLLGVTADVVVHAPAVGFQELAGLRVELTGGFLGGLPVANGPHLDVAAQRRGPALGCGAADAHLHVADQLRQPALDDPQVVVHLKGAILGRGIAQTVHRSGVRPGEHMRHTPTVPQQLDPALVPCL